MTTINEKSDFVGFDYQEITVKRKLESLYTDNYQYFGWQLEQVSVTSRGAHFVNLKFKRNRKLRNKAEISRLQRQFDSIMVEVEILERAKVLKASTLAYVIGVIGTAFMAGSVFAVTSGNAILCAVLAIPGFTGWIIPYWIFRLIREKKTGEVNPMIDQKFDDIYEVCQKAEGTLTI